jgi:hypothetical protein
MKNYYVPTNELLTVQYDMACTDCNSVWEAFAWIVQELPVDDDSMIKRVSQKGYAPNGWPILEVEFGNIDIAKGFTAVYLAAWALTTRKCWSTSGFASWWSPDD